MAWFFFIKNNWKGWEKENYYGFRIYDVWKLRLEDGKRYLQLEKNGGLSIGHICNGKFLEIWIN